MLGVPSRNLDLFFSDEATAAYLLQKNSENFSLAFIEGVMGYYDGIATTTEASSWQLAKATQTPVVLVLNCKGMSVSIAAQLGGYLSYQPDSQIKGVILNQVSKSIYPEIKALIEQRYDVAVCGYMPKMSDCSLESRHLGLVTAEEIGDLQQRLETLARGLERVARTEHAALLSAGRYQGRKIRDAMKETLIIAGFGGQGVLSMGKILAYSGVMQDFEVTWMPSYGPEMRGGTANVTVILSDRKISSPIAHEFDTAIILNQQSMEKFEPMVRPGGILIYDTNGITRHPVREDIEVYAIDATAECARMGQAKLFNTMILGGYLKVRPVVEMENVMVGLKKSLPERAWKMLPANEEAIRHGGEIIRKVR